MRPRFDNKGMNTLYYCLMWCSAIAAGLALVFYKSGKISLAAVVAICVLFAFFALFDMGWNFLSKKENAAIIDESAADEGTSEPGLTSTRPKRHAHPSGFPQSADGHHPAYRVGMGMVTAHL